MEHNIFNVKMFQVRVNIAWKNTHTRTHTRTHTHTHTHAHTHTHNKVFFSPSSILEIAGLIYIFEKTFNLNDELMGK